MDIRVVYDTSYHQSNSLQMGPLRNIKTFGNYYQPLVYVNDFWSLDSDYYWMNRTTDAYKKYLDDK